jgi:DNA invertase Pin-like site-specific DNA recombinase
MITLVTVTEKQNLEVGMKIGYARVSTREQTTAMQRDALEAAGCDRLYEDKVTGERDDRPELRAAMEALREGDQFVVYKLDRLGRSMRSLVKWVGELRDDGIEFSSLTDSIDTTTAQGRFFFHVMASLAEMERELIVERTQAGLQAARKRGRIGGAKPKMTPSKRAVAVDMFKNDHPPREIAKTIGVSVATLYRWLPASDR